MRGRPPATCAGPFASPSASLAESSLWRLAQEPRVAANPACTRREPSLLTPYLTDGRKLLRIVTRVSTDESRGRLLKSGADAVVSNKSIGALRLASEKSDAAHLARDTWIPTIVWVALFWFVALICLWAGGRRLLGV